MWSTADDSIICRFTSDAKDKPIGMVVCVHVTGKVYLQNNMQRNLSKLIPEQTENLHKQDDFTSTKFLCNFNLCKPNTCLN